MKKDGSGFRVQGSEFRVQSSGFRVQGSEFRVQSSGFRVQGSGLRVHQGGAEKIESLLGNSSVACGVLGRRKPA
jgi:hypothetical protein